MRPLALSLLLLVATGSSGPASLPAFEQLKALVGDWEARLADGRTVDVSYRLYSADSVLLETFGSARPTLTAYHRDGDRVLATHYCAQGNQPRLELASAKDGRLVFEFKDATNLAEGASHLRHLELERVDADHFERVETYRTGADDDTTRYSFTRSRGRPADR